MNAESTPGRRRSGPTRSRALANLGGTILGQGLLVLLIVVLPQGDGRAVAGVLFLLGAPALAVFLPLQGKDMLSALIVAGATAVVVNAVVAQVMVATGMRPLTGGVVAIAVISLLMAVFGYASAVLRPKVGGRAPDMAQRANRPIPEEAT